MNNRALLNMMNDKEVFKNDDAKVVARRIGALLAENIKKTMKTNPEKAQDEIRAVYSEILNDWARHGDCFPWVVESIYDYVLGSFEFSVSEIMPDYVPTIAVSPSVYRFCEEMRLINDELFNLTLSPDAQDIESDDETFRDKMSLFIPEDKINLLLVQLPAIKCADLKRFWFNRYFNGKISMKDFFAICESVVPGRKGEKGWTYNNFKR